MKANYTLQRAGQADAEYFETDLPEHQGLYDSELNYGPAGWDRTHNSVLSSGGRVADRPQSTLPG